MISVLASLMLSSNGIAASAICMDSCEARSRSDAANRRLTKIRTTTSANSAIKLPSTPISFILKVIRVLPNRFPPRSDRRKSFRAATSFVGFKLATPI